MREPALDDEGWSGWFCEIPGAGDALAVVVAYFRVSRTHRTVRCVTLETLPHYHE